MAIDKALLLQLLANAAINTTSLISGANNNPLIEIQSDPTNSIIPQSMDYDGNIAISDTSRGIGENGLPLVDWETVNIHNLGDENTPELANLYGALNQNSISEMPEEIPTQNNIVPGTDIPWDDRDMDELHSTEMWDSGANYQKKDKLKDWYKKNRR